MEQRNNNFKDKPIGFGNQINFCYSAIPFKHQ